VVGYIIKGAMWKNWGVEKESWKCEKEKEKKETKQKKIGEKKIYG
jgi:hypothetical protein